MSNGIAQGYQQVTPALIHIITLGTLGTLTGAIMLRLANQSANRSEADLGRKRVIVAFTLLIAVATVLRLMVPSFGEGYLTLLWCAAAAWSLAWLTAAGRCRRDTTAVSGRACRPGGAYLTSIKTA
ncbi:hypothetical protein GCM10007159_39740 [Modicisalibacter luteus]|nr:hypothetical protein GCM10007159_39740 [Halomonas lutea]